MPLQYVATIRCFRGQGLRGLCSGGYLGRPDEVEVTMTVRDDGRVEAGPLPAGWTVDSKGRTRCASHSPRR